MKYKWPTSKVSKVKAKVQILQKGGQALNVIMLFFPSIGLFIR